MKINNTMCLVIFLFSPVFILNVNAQIGTPPNPNAGSATVDGDISEWDLTIGGLDYFDDMYRAWNQGGGQTGQPVLSHLYLRYDCSTEIMYVLVYQKDDTLPLIRVGGDHYVATPSNNNKVVDESDESNVALPLFAYVDIDYGSTTNSARGFE